MLKSFPYLNENSCIINKYNSLLIRDTLKKSVVSLNNEALDFLLLCDGTNSFESIILNSVKETPNIESINDYIDKTVIFFKNLSECDYILYSEISVNKPLNIFSTPNICYPDNIAFELTDYCNLNCKHCYRNSDPSKSNFIDTERVISVISELSRYGLKSVHFTGGEPGTHKDFIRLLKNALDYCKEVIIISNGTCFDEQALEVFAANPSRIRIQVDLDGPNEIIHDELRGAKGAFNSVTKFIKEAAKRKIPIDTAMNVYVNNFEYIEETLKLSKLLGASSFSVSTVMEYGRGNNVACLNKEQTFEFMNIISVLYEKYEGFIRKPESTFDDIVKRLNCGGGYRSIVCSPNGDIRPCILLPEDTIVMGNLFTEKIDELFSKPIFKHYANLQAPNKDVCGECAFVNSCTGCFARILLSEEKMKIDVPNLNCEYKQNLVF